MTLMDGRINAMRGCLSAPMIGGFILAAISDSLLFKLPWGTAWLAMFLINAAVVWILGPARPLSPLSSGNIEYDIGGPFGFAVLLLIVGVVLRLLGM